jgi:hypothetical protein
MTMPSFLRHPDPEREHNREWARDAYAQRGSQDRRFWLNYGYGQSVFTVDEAIVWAERLASEVLP